MEDLLNSDLILYLWTGVLMIWAVAGIFAGEIVGRYGQTISRKDSPIGYYIYIFVILAVAWCPWLR